MIAFGTLKDKSAFKLYAKAKNLPFDLANEISQQIEKYEKALKYAEDDEKDLIDIADYVDAEYMPLVEESKKYKGIISDKKSHPCAYLLYSGNIKEEIGLIRCQSESSGKSVITTVIDGLVAEKYRFLKNDILKVDVVMINKLVYDRIGIRQFNVDELISLSENNQKIWDIYRKGLTVCINQTESESTTLKVKRYLPQNISELTAFSAGIRPSFKSMYDIFEKRVSFEYGIKAFDSILQTEELPYSFVLYQEQIMATLAYAGFPKDETYTILKAISKKREEIILPLKQKFIEGFSNKIKEQEPYLSNEMVEGNCLKVWKIIEDSVEYGFNASHAYCVSLDSLDGAYLKSHYPFEFYEVALNYYTEKGNKEKVAKLIKEMDIGFGIKLGKYKFGLDNRGFKLDKENNCINPSIESIKYLNYNISEELYALKDNKYDLFTELLIDIIEKTSCNTKQLEILIRLDYFSYFGKSKKLLDLYLATQKGVGKYHKNHTDKTKIKRKEVLKQLEETIPNEDFLQDEKIKAQLEFMGYSNIILPQQTPDVVMVADIEKKYTHPMVTLYRLCDGSLARIKVKNNNYQENKFEIFDLLRIVEIKPEPKWKLVGKQWKPDYDDKELVLKIYNIIK